MLCVSGGSVKLDPRIFAPTCRGIVKGNDVMLLFTKERRLVETYGSHNNPINYITYVCLILPEHHRNPTFKCKWVEKLSIWHAASLVLRLSILLCIEVQWNEM